MIGNCASSFIIHNEITSLMSTNKTKKNNGRDVKISFGLVSLILAIIGVVGYFGILGRKPVIADPITIYDYFEGENIISFLLAVLFTL